MSIAYCIELLNRYGVYLKLTLRGVLTILKKKKKRLLNLEIAAAFQGKPRSSKAEAFSPSYPCLSLPVLPPHFLSVPCLSPPRALLPGTGKARNCLRLRENNSKRDQALEWGHKPFPRSAGSIHTVVSEYFSYHKSKLIFWQEAWVS